MEKDSTADYGLNATLGVQSTNRVLPGRPSTCYRRHKARQASSTTTQLANFLCCRCFPTLSTYRRTSTIESDHHCKQKLTLSEESEGSPTSSRPLEVLSKLALMVSEAMNCFPKHVLLTIATSSGRVDRLLCASLRNTAASLCLQEVTELMTMM